MTIYGITKEHKIIAVQFGSKEMFKCIDIKFTEKDAQARLQQLTDAARITDNLEMVKPEPVVCNKQAEVKP